MNDVNFCVKCGNKLAEGQQFCPKCGNKVSGVTSNNVENKEVSKKISKCKFCKMEIDKKAKICPHCGKKQKGTPGCVIVFFVIFILVGVGYVFNYMYDTHDLEIVNDTGKYNQLGLAFYEGDLVNKGKSDISNIRIKYTCYNDSREEIGILVTKIAYIKAGETLHFKAEGLVKYTEGVKCSHKIDRNYDEK